MKPIIQHLYFQNCHWAQSCFNPFRFSNCFLKIRLKSHPTTSSHLLFGGHFPSFPHQRSVLYLFSDLYVQPISSLTYLYDMTSLTYNIHLFVTSEKPTYDVLSPRIFPRTSFQKGFILTCNLISKILNTFNSHIKRDKSLF